MMLNTACSIEKVPTELRALYDYIHRDKISSDDELVNKIDERVCSPKESTEVKNAMTLYDELLIEKQLGREEGRAEGRAEERINSIAALLKNGGTEEQAVILLNATKEQINAAKLMII